MRLIAGGTGTLGRALTRRLLASGAGVRILTRNAARAADMAALGAEIVVGDLVDRASVERACRGVTAVVAAAHSLFGRGRYSSLRVDGQAHRDLIDIACRAGVGHFVYTSVYRYGPAYDAVPMFRLKGEIEQYLKASGLSHTIVRPTAFMESHAHALIGEPILEGRPVPMFGRGDQPRNFVAADDVAAVVELALQRALDGETIDVAGPGNHTSMDVVRMYERASGRSARVLHLPLPLMRAAAAAIRPLHPGISQVITAGVLADTTDQRVDVSPLVRRLSVTATPLAAFVDSAVAAHGR